MVTFWLITSGPSPGSVQSRVIVPVTLKTIVSPEAALASQYRSVPAVVRLEELSTRLVTLWVAAELGKAAPRTTRNRLTTSTCRASFEGIRRCDGFAVEVEEAEAEDDKLAKEAIVRRRADGVAMW
jgi:hypothetical protein